HGPRLDLALRLPAGSAPLVGARRLAAGAPEQTRLLATAHGLAVAVTVPVTTQAGEPGGALAFATPIDLSSLGDRLAPHALAAALVGLDRPVPLAGDPTAATTRHARHLSIPLRLDQDLAPAPLAIDAVLAGAVPVHADHDLAYACFAIACLLALMALVRRSDLSTRLEA
ncbi:MAG TPA: hypothetical protein VHE35_35755, partial [Kofleriaceae bacterium]|nr:hypothetical protein [Kofleriaceae bacterium]